MRILILSREYPPAVVGGQGTFVRLITNALADKGHQVTLIIPRQTTGIEERKNVKVHEVPLIGGSFVTRFPSFFMTSMRAFKNAVTHADIIYSHGSLVSSPKNIPVLTHLHSSRIQLARASFRSKKYFHATLNAIFCIYDWLLVAQSDAIITPCSENQQLLSNPRSNWGKRIYHIPNGIDIKSISKLRRDIDPEDTNDFNEHKPMKVLYYGRIDVSKGLNTLISAVSLATQINISLTIMGEGPLKRQLKQQAALTELQITFVDAKEHAEALKFASDFDLVILPSLFESFGMVTIESMALGIPVLTSDSCPEFGQTRFQGGDERSLVEAMSEVYQNYRAYLITAKSLQKHVAKYDISHTADDIIQLMQEILQPSRS